MKAMTLREAAGAMNGRLFADPTTEAHGASVDSRRVRHGDLFFALPGRHDGADFAGDAIERGAVAAVAPRQLSVPTIVVENPMEALAALARHSLSTMESPPQIVGITGSVGKTTTKDALAAILRFTGRRVFATEGNYNNEVGLPLTILSVPHNTETLVLEMGATHRGDIEYLCGIARPGIGVLTAVSPVHLDSFGSLEDLARAKGELAVALPGDGVMVSPRGVPLEAVGGGRSFARHIVFSREAGEGVQLWASGVTETAEGISFTVHYQGESGVVNSPVFGTHLVEPLLASIGGGLGAGLSLQECVRGLGRIKRTGLRGELYHLREEILIYDDSYNASPVATSAVLRYCAGQVAELKSKGERRRLVAVLGGMFELGGAAREYHREIGALADELGVDLLVCVGDEARWYAETFSGQTLFYNDASDAIKGLRDYLRPKDYIMVKGSRGVGLDKITLKLKEELSLV